MSTPKDGPIKIEPGFSKWLAAYLLLVHTSALIIILLLPLSLPLGTTLALLVGASLWYYWRRDLLHIGAHSIIRIEWSEANGWRMWLGDGDIHQATLIPTSFMHRHLVTLDLMTTDSGVHRLLLPGDIMQPELHRRLRVLLKLENHFGE